MARTLLVILALVFQPLTLWLANGPLAPAAECAATSCCEVVVQASCCGEPLIEQEQDHRDACRCGMSSNDDPEPTPNAPMPRTEVGAVVVLVELTGETIDEDAARAPRRAPEPVILSALRTHNETQALLSVWRT
jgi:hypothetical protein